MSATPYYALQDFVNRTTMPASDVTGVETDFPGKVEFLIAQQQAWIDARLRKRYAVPFNQNGGVVQEIVLKWLTALVTPDVYRARGANAAQDDEIKRLDELADQARAEVKEAADSVDGLFDLPLLDSATASAITGAQVLFHSNASPFVWMDRQRWRGRREDGGGFR